MDGLVVEIHVGEGGKQPVRQKTVGMAGAAGGADGGFRQTNQPADQLVLEIGSVRLFAADAGADAALVPGGLLALIAKHIGHENSSRIK